MDPILDVTAPLVKKNGMIHFYTFKNRHQVPLLVEEYETKGLGVLFPARAGTWHQGCSAGCLISAKCNPEPHDTMYPTTFGVVGKLYPGGSPSC